jgi:hypothetical protein
MAAPPTFKPDDIELIPDAWGRFERAVAAVSKSGPQHRARKATPSRRSEAVAPWGADWQELGFENEPAIAEGPRGGPSPHSDSEKAQRRVVCWAREIEGGFELSFDPPTELS